MARGRRPERTTGLREREELLHARERPHQRVRRGRSPCMESSSRRPGQARQHKRPESTRFRASITSLCLPEEEPPDAENIEEDSWSHAEMERCPKPRTAKRRRESEEDKGKCRRSPCVWMGAGAQAVLEDHAQANSRQAQNDGELEAGSLMADQIAGFGFIFLMTWF